MIRFFYLCVVVVVIKVHFYRKSNHKKNKFDKLKLVIKIKDIALAHLGQAENEMKKLKHRSSSPGLGSTRMTNHWFLFFFLFFFFEKKSKYNEPNPYSVLHVFPT